MTAARRRVKPLTIIVEQPDRLPQSGRLFGPVRAVIPAIRAAESPWQFDAQLRAYLVPRHKLADIMAALEQAGHRVDLPLGGWSR